MGGAEVMRDRYVLGGGKARAMPKMFPCRHNAGTERPRRAFASGFGARPKCRRTSPGAGCVRRLHTIRAPIVATAPGWGRIVGDGRFVYHPNMVAEPSVEISAAGIAGATC